MGKARRALEENGMQGQIYAPALEKRYPGQVQIFEGKVAQILEPLRVYSEVGEAADRNPELTPLGRSRAKGKAAAAAVHSLTELHEEHVAKPRAMRDARMAALLNGGAVKRPTDPAERLAYELRLREIRDELRNAEPIERDLIYLTTTNPQVIDALETAPPVLVRPDKTSPRTLAPFVDPERVAFARIERARRQAPDEADTLELITELTNVYDSMIQTALNAIGEEVPATADDPVAEQAR